MAFDLDASPAVHLAAHGPVRADAGDLSVASAAAGHNHPIRRNPRDRHQYQHAGSSCTDHLADDSTHHGLPDRGADHLADDSPYHHGRNPHAEPYTEPYADHADFHHPGADAYLILSVRRVVHPPGHGAAAPERTTA
ncbi:MAG: hypothetical protein ACYDDU_12905 [Dermatophilaceae bacterium]